MKKIFFILVLLITYFGQAQDPQEFFAPLQLNVIPNESVPDSIAVFNNKIISNTPKSYFDQQLTLSNDTLYLTDGGNVKLGDLLGGSGTWGGITGTLSDQTDLQGALDAKEPTLISGTTIKTINGLDITGAGNLVIATGGDLLSTNNLSDVTDAPTAIGNLGGLPIAGGIMTGPLELGGNLNAASFEIQNAGESDFTILSATTGLFAPNGTTGQPGIGSIFVDTDDSQLYYHNGTGFVPAGAGSGDLLAINNLSDVNNITTSRSNLGLEIGVDVQAYNALTDLDGTDDVNTDATSRVQNIKVWMGTKAQFAIDNPVGAGIEIIYVTDSIAPLPTGTGDMTTAVYDSNTDGVVQNSDLLEGNNTAYHLNRTNHTGTQLASTISDFQTAVSTNTNIIANNAKVTNATHTGEVTGSTALTIASNVVDSDNIVNASVTGGDIASATINVGNMANNSVGTNQIVANAVTVDKMSLNATLLPTVTASYSFGSQTFKFSHAFLNGKLYQDSNQEDWSLAPNLSTGNYVFGVDDNDDDIYTTLYGLDASGTPAANTDLITKGYADANYGSTQTGQNSFTATLTGGSGGTYTISSNNCQYYRIGNLVHFSIELGLISGSAPTGSLLLGGLPYTTTDANNMYACEMTGGSVDYYSVQARLTGTNQLSFDYQNTLDNSNSSTMSNVDFTNGTIFVSGTYYTTQSF